MISKELLNEVLKKEIREFVIEKNELRYILKDDINNIPELYFINIYELSHKCKEWADKEGYLLSSIINNGKAFSNVSHKTYPHKNICWSNITEYNTEPEAIFKTCQWILDNKAN